MRFGARGPPGGRPPRAGGHLTPTARGTPAERSGRHPCRDDRDRGARMIEKLRPDFRGALLLPGEEGYDDARRVWNGAIDRSPAVIARCAGADDVATAVRFA